MFNIVKEYGVVLCMLCHTLGRHDVKDFKTLRFNNDSTCGTRSQKFSIAQPSSDNSALSPQPSSSLQTKSLESMLPFKFRNAVSISQATFLFPYSNLFFRSLADCCVRPAIAWKKKADRSNSTVRRTMSSLPSSPLECSIPNG